nr:hypothetical protein [Tanacetum cinerariifolium]
TKLATAAASGGSGLRQQRVFEHSAFARLSATLEGSKEELAPEEEIESVEGPVKELVFPKSDLIIPTKISTSMILF